MPVLILTGASGFIGKYVLEAFKKEFFIYAFARRPQKAVGVEQHENICWMRLDIGDERAVKMIFDQISEAGGADFVLHLAGYYDFTNTNSPEYERTNVMGTELILKYAQKLNVQRFIFASSLTVSKFDKKGTVLDENSPANATFPYALSKQKGELLLKKYSKNIPCTVVRCSAIYSDWCEYGPLYIFLSMWLSGRYDANILTGKGETAIPYLHINNLLAIFNQIITGTAKLNPFEIFIAGHDGCIYQKELHDLALRYNYGEAERIIFMPVWFAFLGVVILDFWGMIKGKRPFIRPWMVRMTDKKMIVNATWTRKTLDWKPLERFEIRRRILFLIENRKSNPYEWLRRNEQSLLKGGESRPNLMIYESMLSLEDEIMTEIIAEIRKPENNMLYEHYVVLDETQLVYRFRNLYKMLKTAVLLGDRLHVLHYANALAIQRFDEKFEVNEVKNAISLVGVLIVEHLKENPILKSMDLRIHDEILLTVQLISDELDDTYDILREKQVSIHFPDN